MKKVDKEILVLNSLLLVLMLNASFVSYIVSLSNNSIGVIPIIYSFCIVSILILTILQRKILVNKYCIFFIIFIMFWFCISWLLFKGKYTNEYFVNFCSIGIICCLILHNKISPKIVLYGTGILGILFLFNSSKYISSALIENLQYDRINMHSSYILIPIMLSGFYHFLFYREKKLSCFILYIITIITALNSFILLGRGPLLCLIIGIIIGFYYKHKSFFSKKVLLKIIFVIILILSVVFLKDIISSTAVFLEKKGIQIAAISKMKDLMISNDITNGRTVIWNNSIEMIKSNFILGNGIAGFANKYDIWPHNIVLEILLEFGIIGSFVFFYLLVKIIALIFKGMKKSEEIILLALVFSTSFPRLMLSSYFWHHPDFWIFVFLGIIIMTNEKNKLNQEKENE